ncbi:MAG TPA: CBS domain-containing protein [Gammaproteobacteria bacterium]|nr:CBS domain-containing protein [Gammaproteobacteria bacterium]
MAIFTTALQTLPLPQDAPIYRIRPSPPERVSPHDPAIGAMTDFRRIKLITISPEATIDEAMQMMIHAQVRMLIVLDDNGAMLGLITSTDLLGERPVQVSQTERIPHEQILVRQIMTARSQVTAYDVRDIERAHIRDVVVAMRDAGRQHMLVIERDARSGRYVLRGAFSLTQIGKQLGVDIEPGEVAQSFAELERVLLHEHETA